MDTGTLNTQWSQALIAGLYAAGVEHAVISPGSRSTPLALAVLRQHGLQSTVVVDERCAAFFALGIAKATRRPVVVLATSGSAPGNWLPAVIEADQAGVPLILLSADRPPELQGVGANQTIDQSGLFKTQTRATHLLGAPHPGFEPAQLHHLASQIVEAACWPHPGPVHINQPFREPLLPTMTVAPPSLPAISLALPHCLPDEQAIRNLLPKLAVKRGLIICGEIPTESDVAGAITTLADNLGCAIIAEPLANLRFGEHLTSAVCANYLDWLPDDPCAAPFAIDWVLCFGTYPVTRKLQNFLAQIPEQIWVDPWPRRIDPRHRLNTLIRSEVAAFCAAVQRQDTTFPENDLRDLCVKLDSQPTTKAAEYWPVTALIKVAPAESKIFIGNSLAIRQLDAASGLGRKPLQFFGNRGASGIDGNISTALGIARTHGSVIALVGDLTCQHDIGALAVAHELNAIIVVLNNGGGGIFDTLPQADLTEFETGWRTPQALDFSFAAKAFGVSYQGAENREQLEAALKLAINSGGPQLIEVRGL